MRRRGCESVADLLFCLLHFSLIPSSNPNVSLIYSQLKAVSVYEVSSIMKQWTLSKDVHSRRSVGNYKAGSNAQDGYLNIYMTEEGIRSLLPSCELVEPFSKFCGIQDPDHLTLLCCILNWMEPKDINDMFQNHGVPDIPGGETDSVSDSEGNKNLRALAIYSFFVNF
jgi:hypothetical protein